MLTEIQPCEPPEVFRASTSGPSLDIDCAILEHLERSAPAGQELNSITRAVGGTTHRVHSRIRALMNRGLVHREPIPGGPARGPGASEYRLTTAASWTCPS
jgi:DNA-binding HxlR family transcriptional regulator